MTTAKAIKNDLKQPKLSLKPFTNRSGTKSYRVSGTLAGDRVRKNFTTRAKAEAFMVGVIGAHTQAKIPEPIFTHLNEAQVKDAENARQILSTAGLGKVSFSELARERSKQTSALKAIGAERAIELYIESEEKRGITQTQGPKYTLKGAFKGIEYIHQANNKKLSDYILNEESSTRSQRDHYDRIKTFYDKFLIPHGYAETNLIDGIGRPKHRKELPAIFDYDTCKALLAAAANEGALGSNRYTKGNQLKGAMLPYFAVCLFSGLRPTEAEKLNDWKYFDFKEKHIEIPSRIAKTIGRFATLHDNLAEILQACKKAGLNPGFHSRKIRARIKIAAGVDFNWTGPYNDVLRHCYASNRFQNEKDMGKLAYDMGNSPKELKRSYLRPVPPVQARKFAKLVVLPAKA